MILTITCDNCQKPIFIRGFRLSPDVAQREFICPNQKCRAFYRVTINLLRAGVIDGQPSREELSYTYLTNGDRVAVKDYDEKQSALDLSSQPVLVDQSNHEIEEIQPRTGSISEIGRKG